MKRRGFILPTMVLFLLAGLILALTGWLSAGPPTHPDDPLGSEALQRWRSGQPQHWRACLLQQ